MTPKIVGKILEMVNRFEICRSFEEWPGLKRVSKGHFGYAAIGPISNVRLRGDAQGPELMAAKTHPLRRSLPISFRCRRGRCASKIAAARRLDGCAGQPSQQASDMPRTSCCPLAFIDNTPLALSFMNVTTSALYPRVGPANFA